MNNLASPVKPLDGLLVVSIEQAVAAPYCSAALARAGARVIKVERDSGDFARGYDDFVDGYASYFIWLNQGKESLCLDLKSAQDVTLLRNILQQADVLLQNLSLGALARLGLSPEDLARDYPRLIICSINGYGEGNAYQTMPAYDMLIQAEAGLPPISGGGRCGVSIADIITGMNAYSLILEALHQRRQTDLGQVLQVSLFESLAFMMSVPLLQAQHTGASPQYVGLRHPSITPYAAFHCQDGELVIAIQNEGEWQRFCTQILQQAELPQQAGFRNNHERSANRETVEALINTYTQTRCYAELSNELARTRIAHGRVNTLSEVLAHPAYQSAPVQLENGASVQLPKAPGNADWQHDAPSACPALGEHSATIRHEFSTHWSATEVSS